MKSKREILFYIVIYSALFINAYLVNDSTPAIISAFCGMSYTLLAGKGIPLCYPIGIIGTFFYSYLACTNALWGNLLLNVIYYLPMQIIGFLNWNKNLKPDKYEIFKTKLSQKERMILLLIILFITFPVVFVLSHFNDKYPLIDGFVTVLSIIGMYLTVRRAIEQWFIWMVVNALSFCMWINIALNGQRVYSTALMWLLYFFLAIYFYRNWNNEIRNS